MIHDNPGLLTLSNWTTMFGPDKGSYVHWAIQNVFYFDVYPFTLICWLLENRIIDSVRVDWPEDSNTPKGLVVSLRYGYMAWDGYARSDSKVKIGPGDPPQGFDFGDVFKATADRGQITHAQIVETTKPVTVHLNTLAVWLLTKLAATPDALAHRLRRLGYTESFYSICYEARRRPIGIGIVPREPKAGFMFRTDTGAFTIEHLDSFMLQVELDYCQQ